MRSIYSVLRMLAVIAGLTVGSCAYAQGGTSAADEGAAYSLPFDPFDEFAKPPFPSEGSASKEEVHQAAGNAEIRLTCPLERRGDQMGRGARVRLEGSSPAARSHEVLNTLIRAALTEVFGTCWMTGAGGNLGYDVGFVEIDASQHDGDKAEPIFVARRYSGSLDRWAQLESVSTKEEIAASARASAQARAAAETTGASEQPQQSPDLAPLAQNTPSDAGGQQAWRSLLAILEGWGPWVGLGLAIVWLIAKREALARWYFFTFHPHPSERAVRRAVTSASFIEADARALARSLGELPPGSSVLRAVRLAQAEKLFNQLQSASLAKQRELERLARGNAARAHEEAAFYGVQEAIALAATALARAKAAQAAAAAMERDYAR